MKRKCYLVYKTAEQKNVMEKVLSSSTTPLEPILLHEKEMITSYEQAALEIESKDPVKELLTDYTIPVWNHVAMQAIEVLLGREADVTVSPELSQKEIDRLWDALPKEKRQRLVRPVYERIPMMQTKNCIKKTNDACNHQSETVYITDRKGASIPIYTDCTVCKNIIFNSVVLSCHGLWKKQPPSFPDMPIRLRFTIEKANEVSDVLSFFIALESGKESRLPFSSYTTGHMKKPVL